MKVIHLVKPNKTCLVQTKAGKVFPCKLHDSVVDGIMLADYVEVNKSSITGEWIVSDYKINFEVYAAIHNSYQTKIDDLILEEDGVPYE